ncbi:MAG: formate dehydrogenase accessory sulfurtransferase FdhD [Coriobacteriia bacterium]|nr:formate dehydrogenase accessory sulfurtransferase FdhD [Coriobacteriia bacterium]
MNQTHSDKVQNEALRSEMREQITGIVVAGGRSRRMGTDKSFVTLADEPMVKRAVRLLEPYCKRIVIVTNALEATKALGWPDHVKVVSDDIPFQGPLGGLSTGAQHAETPWIFVRAVDMPWLAPNLIDMMYQRALDKKSDVVIPLSDRGNEPLCALYSRAAVMKWVQRVLDTGRRRVIAFFQYVRVDAIPQEEIRKLDPNEDSFLNINHPDQLVEIDTELKNGDCVMPSEKTSQKAKEKERGKDGGAFESKQLGRIHIETEMASGEVTSGEVALGSGEESLRPSLREPKPSLAGNAIKVLHQKPGSTRLPTEKPFTIYLNDIEISTVQATESHLDDMALGFLVSEGLLSDRNLLKSVDIDKKHGLIYVESDEVVPSKLIHKTSKRYVTSGCGKGVTFSSIDDVAAFERVKEELYIEPSDLHEWIKKMTDISESYKTSGGSHSSAIVIDGELKVVREDVGRHNAVDKVIGNAWRKGLDMRKAILLCTGRLSYEITAKSARQHIPLIASRSAATDLSVSIAQEVGITLAGYVKATQIVVYTHPERIVGGERY